MGSAHGQMPHFHHTRFAPRVTVRAVTVKQRKTGTWRFDQWHKALILPFSGPRPYSHFALKNQNKSIMIGGCLVGMQFFKSDKFLMGAFLLTVVIFWWRLFLQGWVPFHVDTLCFYYPNWSIAKNSFLWDSLRNMGQPFMAVPQTQALYPFQIIARLVNYVDFIRLSVVFHTLISAGFAFLFFKRIYQTPSLPILGALIFGFSGPFFMRVVFQADFATMAWIPALLYFTHEKKPKLLGIFLAIQWLAGYPPLFLISLIFIVLYSLITQGWKLTLKFMGLAGLIGAGLSSIQWIPFLEMLRESVRPVFLDQQTAAVSSVQMIELVKGLFIPSFLQNKFPHLTIYRTSFYWGPIVTGLFIWGFVKGNKQEKWLGALTIISLVFSTGLINVRIFRYPGNWLLMAHASMAIVAIYGLGKLKLKNLRGILVAIIACDFLIFALPKHHPWGDQTFITDISGIDIKLSSSPGRIYHDERLIDEYSRWDFTDTKSWIAIKQFLLPSIGPGAGIPEVGSHHNLTSHRNFEFRTRLLNAPLDSILFDLSHIAVQIKLSDHVPPFATPSENEIAITENTNFISKVFSTPKETQSSLLEERPGFARIQMHGPGLLIYSESYYPGWNVKIDNQKKEIKLFENNFLSVEVEAGDHEVTFSYSPISFKIGLFITFITILLLVSYKIGFMRFKNLLLLAMLFTSAFPEGSQAAKKITITGSSTVGPIIEASLTKINAKKKQLKAKFMVSNSGQGLREFAENKADLLLMSREITPEEYKKYSETNFHVTHIARDAVIPAVSYHIFLAHVNMLTVKELADIFNGKITNWKEVGGPDSPIELILQDENSGTLKTFITGIFQNLPFEPPPHYKPRYLTNTEVQNAVAFSTRAIAALPMNWTSHQVRGIGIKIKGRSVYPTIHTVLDNQYPTSRYLSVVTHGEPQKEIAILIDYLLSKEGQALIKELQLVPLYRH